MKYYLIEPQMKKSVVEVERFDRINDDGIVETLEVETGWRTGGFMIIVPETAEEIQEYLEQRGYDTLSSFLEDRNADTLEEALLPSESDEQVDLSEDYEYEFLYTDDGSWGDFRVDCEQMDEDELYQYRQQLEELFEEESYSGLEGNGWQSLGTEYYIDCPVTVVPCDENGEAL